MKKLFLLLCAVSLMAKAQIPFFHQYKSTDTNDVQRGFKHLCFLSNGDVLSSEYINSVQGPTYAHLVRTDTMGNVTWSRKLSLSNDLIGDMASASNGTYLVSSVGYTSFITRTDTAVNFLWNKVFSGAPVGFQTLGNYVVAMNDGCVAGGTFYNSSLNNDQAWFTKLDSSGNQVWSRSYSLPNFEVRLTNAKPIPLADNGLVIPFQLWHSDTAFEYQGCGLMRVDSTGNPVWLHVFTDSIYTAAQSIQMLPDSGFILTGGRDDQNPLGPELFVLRTDKYGNLLWNRHYNIVAELPNMGLCRMQSGNYLCGFANVLTNNPYPINRAVFVQFDTSGQLLASYMVGAPDSLAISGLIQTTSGNFIAGGYKLHHTSPYNIEYGALFGLDPAGNGDCSQSAITLAVDTLPLADDTVILNTAAGPVLVASTLPGYTSLSLVRTDCTPNGIEELNANNQVSLFPNPASGDVQLNSDNGMSQVTVYDANGKLVYQVELKHEEHCLIPSATFSAGIYLVHVIFGNGVTAETKLLRTE